MQRKKKAEDSPEQEVTPNGTSSSSPTEEECPPASKKTKTSEEPQTLTNGISNGEEHLKPARTNPDGKSSSTSSKVISRRQRAQEAPNGDSRGSKLGFGSAASTIVRKAKSELDSSFKPARADPKATDAYKALFHSAEERPKDKQAHWVTFFPYH